MEISKEMRGKNWFLVREKTLSSTKVIQKLRNTSKIISESVKVNSKNKTSIRNHFNREDGILQRYHLPFKPGKSHSPSKFILEDFENLYRFIENTNLGICILDANFTILRVNKAVEKTLGRPASFFEGLNVKEMRRGSFSDANLKTPSQEEECSFVVPFFLNEEIRTMYAEFTLGGSTNRNEHFFLIKNVTELFEIEAQLRKSDTLTIVGQLAAGIAHEIRNPMTALKGFIQLLESSVKEDHTLYFSVIQSELERIETIITDFLVLAKPQSVQYQTVDLKVLIDHTIELLSAQALMHNVQFEKDYHESLPTINGEPNQLKQVIINLLKNAIEVMPKGGTIKISLTSDEDGLHFSVKDKGCGIPEDKIMNLGQPFYTTKERGTGLGLMVSYKIIKEHYGKIQVESELNKGTTFHVYLPF
jgi:two-component system, sporulation sensor kinase E